MRKEAVVHKEEEKNILNDKLSQSYKENRQIQLKVREMQTRLKQAEIKLTKMTTFTKEFKQLQEQLKQAGLVNTTIIL